MSLVDILEQYALGAAPSRDFISSHFDQVAQQVSQLDLGRGIAVALRTDLDTPFDQAVRTLFTQSSPRQQAGLLKVLMRSFGQVAMTSAAGRILTTLMGIESADGIPTITPQQAARVLPDVISAIASRALQHNPSTVESVGMFYAQHPDPVKSLGLVQLSAIMGYLYAHR